MSKPRPKRNDPDDITRVDAFRSDEDTGGDAAPPLRPRDEVGSRAPARPEKPAER